MSAPSIVSCSSPTELGTIWGPIRRQVHAERSSRIRDGLGVGVQVTLGGNQRSVPGDLPEDVDRNADVGHPGQAGVAQVVAAQMLVAQVGDDLVPVGRVAEHGRGDSTAARPGEDPPRWVIVNSMEAFSTSGRASSMSGTVRARLP
jgi:hypothetical protein